MDEIAAQVYGKELIRKKFRGQTINLVVLRDRDSTSIFEAHQTVEAFNNRHRTCSGSKESGQI